MATLSRYKLNYRFTAYPNRRIALSAVESEMMLTRKGGY